MKLALALLAIALLCTGCSKEQPATYDMTMYPMRDIAIDAGACPAYTDLSFDPKRLSLRPGESCTLVFTAPKKVNR